MLPKRLGQTAEAGVVHIRACGKIEQDTRQARISTGSLHGGPSRLLSTRSCRQAIGHTGVGRTVGETRDHIVATKRELCGAGDLIADRPPALAPRQFKE
jgi:hypothetical protein